MGGPRGGGRGGLLQPALLPRPDRRPDRPLAPALHGGAVLGLRRDRAEHRHARPGALGRGPGRDAGAAPALGARVLRRAGRPQARRALRVRARGRQRRPQPAHHRTPRRRRLGARRPQDLDRQRRHRQRARGQRDRRPGARPSRPGAVHRPRRHARAAHGAQAREARLPRLAHGRAEVRELPDPGREPARRRRQARAPAGRGAQPQRQRALIHAGRLRADAADGRRPGARHRPRSAGVRVRVRVVARGVRRADPREAGHLLRARRHRRWSSTRRGC